MKWSEVRKFRFAYVSVVQLKYSHQFFRFYSHFSHQIFHIKQNCNSLLSYFHFAFCASSIFHFASSFIFISLLIVHFAFIFFIFELFRRHANKAKKIASVSIFYENEWSTLLLQGVGGGGGERRLPSQRSLSKPSPPSTSQHRRNDYLPSPPDLSPFWIHKKPVCTNVLDVSHILYSWLLFVPLCAKESFAIVLSAHRFSISCFNFTLGFPENELTSCYVFFHETVISFLFSQR